MKDPIRRVTQFAHRATLPRLRRIAARDDSPLFVIGSGRSGNTLVRRILLASGQIHIPPETYVLGDVIETWPLSVALPWNQRVWLFCAQFEKHYHFPDFGLPNLNAFAAEAIRMQPRGLRPLIEALYRHLARAAGSQARRWGDKTPWNAFYLPAIGHLFPDARFLWLIRDGRDVALSYHKAGLQPDFETAAQRWTEANLACARFARWSRNVRRLHYEDLVTDPEREMAAIFAWADLRFDPTMLDSRSNPMGDVERHAHHGKVAAPISASSVGRWRDGVSEADLTRTPNAFGLTLTRLGYS
ncbi:MAG: sulfotransferase [Pseudomonadota bacterium]